MSTGINGIKKVAAASFAMLYLLLALSYVHLLPNYNNLLRSGYYGGKRHMTAKAAADMDSASHRPLMRKLFYATVENKRQLLSGILFTGVIATALFVFSAIFASRIESSHGNLSAWAVVHRYAYLHYLNLRL